MRILEITFNSPDKRSGGGLGIYQSIISIANNFEIDYIGPYFDTSLFSNTKHKVNILSFLSPKKINPIKKILRLIFKKVSTSFYDSWIESNNKIEWEKYDFVHIEFSRYNFLVETCHQNQKKCIVRVHNIETDYAYNLFQRNKNIFTWLRYFSFMINEKYVLKKADGLIFLTNNDINRARELINIYPNKIFKNPVCVEQNYKINRNLKHKEFNILLTGSLNYGPNCDGIIWFLDNVWKKLEDNVNFQDVNVIIAGSYPNIEIKKYIKKCKNVQLIDTPDDMKPYFQVANIYIAPVFDGAGMKVKVAEALSYGLPVIGTSHAFIGYEDLETGKYIANNIEEFCLYLIKLKLDNCYATECVLNEFRKNFSMESSIKRYSEIFCTMEGKKNDNY